MKKRLLILTVALLLVCLALASCGGDKKIEKLSLTGGLKYKYELNETPDFSKVTATVTYNDGTSEDLTADKLTFSTIDTSKSGKQQLTITYQDYTLTIEVEILGKSLDFSDIDEIGGTIMGTEYPAWYREAQAQRNWSKYQIKDSTYKVGDANPFEFRLQLDILNDADEEVDYTGAYTSISTVHLVNGTELSLAGSEYVTVDEAKNTFKFTAAAVGKTFKISTRPLYGVEVEDEADFTRSITVEIVSGYNVTDAKELNLLTNENNLSSFVGVTTPQSELAQEFINNQYGTGYYETYGANNLKGIVLHRNLSPTANDIPAKYLYTYPAGHAKAGEKAFHNGNFVVYNHKLTENNKSFGFYGNYFQINCRQMPDACDATVDEYGKSISNDKLFAFVVDGQVFNTEAKFAAFDHSQYTTLVENVSFFGNDASSNDEKVNEQRLLALAALNTRNNTTTLKNIAIECFNNSLIIQNDNQTVNLDNVFFNNAWQGQIYVWVHNGIQEDLPGDHDDVAPLPGHQPIRLNITNSTLTKSGGPVVMAQIETDDGVVEPINQNSALHVNVDAATVMWAYANGTEAWYTAVGMSGPASTLMALNEPIAGYGAYNETPSAFTTKDTKESAEPSKDAQANLIFLSMCPKDTFTIGGKLVYSSAREEVIYHFTEGEGSVITPDHVIPLLVSSEGGSAIYTNDLKDITNQSNILATGENCGKFFSGDYISVHTPMPDPNSGAIMSTGVLMEYFHS